MDIGRRDAWECLLAFPSAVLARCWPPQRVLMGIRVCKRLRDELLLHVDEISLVKSREEAVDAQAIAAGLQTMRDKHVSLTWKSCHGACADVFLDGLERVMHGVRKPLLKSIHIVPGGIVLPSSSASTCEEVSMELEQMFLTEMEKPDVGFFGENPGWGLEKLPSVIEGCTSLTHLRIPSCGIASAAGLCKALCTCSGLEVLDLRNNILRGDTMKCFFDALRGCNALAVLDVSLNHLQDQGVTDLMAAVAHCTALRVLKLGSTGICLAETVAAVGQACAHFTALGHLDLSDSSLGLSVASLAPTPDTHFANLHSLGLRTSGMHVYGTKSLSKILPRCPKLRNLDLRCNALDDKAAANLSAGLEACRALSHLSLVNCKLKAPGAESLAAGLAGCLALQHLDLSYNSIADAGLASLVAVLRRSDTLRGLVLRSVRMTEAGAQPISTLLQDCSTLTRLDLSRNKFGPAGAVLLAPALGATLRLARLELKGTKLGAEGAEAIASALNQSRGLEHVDLAVNGFDDTCADRILAAVRSCERLGQMDISGNPEVSPAAQARFARALSERGVACVVGEGNVDPSFY